MQDQKKASTMMIKRSFITLILMSCVCFKSNAQKSSSFTNIYTSTTLKKFEVKSDSITTLNIQPSLTTQNYQAIYQSCLGVFCKFENEVLKSANVPVRFRLGSTEYVDRLEQKIPAYKDVSQLKSNN